MNTDVQVEGSFSGYQRDRVFYNPDDPRVEARGFFETGYVFGLDDDHDGRCVVPFDMDGDGDLDLASWSLQGLRLYENTGAAAHFARVRLAQLELGTVVRLRAGGVVRSDVVRLVEGFQSQLPSDVHFGLGELEAIESLRIEWPDGHVDEWPDLPVDRLLTVEKGADAVSVRELPRWPEGSWPSPSARPEVGREALGLEGPSVVLWTANAQPAGLDALVELAASHPQVAWHRVGPSRQSSADGEPWKTSAPNEALTQAFFGSKSGAPEAAVFVFDAEGRACRTYLRWPDAPELGAVLEALADEPPFGNLLVLSARRRLARGQNEEALALFQRATEVDPRSPQAFEGVGRTSAVLGDLGAAEAAYARSVEVDPDYALGHYNLGVTRVELGRFDEAIEPFHEALRIQGDNVNTLLALAEAGALGTRTEAALDALARATAVAPESVDAWVLYGKVLGREGRLQEALARFDRALQLDPERADARAAYDATARRLGLDVSGR